MTTLERTTNMGRCKRCDFSTKKLKAGAKRSQRWCNHYANWCKPVARNCLAPTSGYRFGDVIG